MYRHVSFPSASAAVQRWYDPSDDVAFDPIQPSCIASERELSYMLPQLLASVESQGDAASSTALNWLLRVLRARIASRSTD